MTDLSQSCYTHIIHIADLHIRTGDPDRARIEEYKVVLDEFLKQLRVLPCVKAGTALTVIAGDVFHNKGRIESAGFQLFSRFVNKLSAMTPVVLICGNHDFRQEDPNIPDMLESMLDPWLENERVRYLKDTGHYEMGNVGFGVVSVKDTLRFGNTRGITSQLPPFPSVGMFSEAVQHRAALFHGMVRACRLQNGASANQTAYPLEWFKGYDMLLLGDVHKQQIHKTADGMPWGYPGSLVQQDFGEGIYGHGFLLWDLATYEATAHHITNPFGLVTIRNKKTTFDFEVYTGAREWTPLENAVKTSAFPKRPMVRVYDATYQDTEEVLKSHGVYARNIHVLSSQDAEDVETESAQETHETEPLTDLCQPEKWKEYMHQVAPHLSTEVEEWFDAPERMNLPPVPECAEVPPTITTKINDRMAKITKLLHAYREALGAQGSAMRNRIQLKKVAWDYTLCYGQGNYFDFDSIKGNIALLNGKNASGKSSFMEMLCLGLFGEQIRTRVVAGKKMSAKVIHSKKPLNKRAMNIRVHFSINDQAYEVIREFGTQADKSNVSQFGVELFAIDEEKNTKTLVREGTTAVNTWMEKYLGSMENVLMSNFITQLDQANFFLLKQDEQKNILERALNLESVTALAALLHEARLGHTFAVSTVSTIVETTNKMRTTNAVDRPELLEARLLRLEGQYEAKTLQLHELQRQVGSLQSQCKETATNDDLEQERDACLALLEQIGEVTEEEKQLLYEVKGARVHEIKTLETKLATLAEHATDMELDDLYERANELEAFLQQLEREKPSAPSTSVDAFKQLKASCQGFEVPNITAEEMETCLQQLNEVSVTKPKTERQQPTIELCKFSEHLQEYQDLVDQKRQLQETRVVSNFNQEDHTAWQKKYKAWLKRNDGFINDENTLEDYENDKKELLCKIQVQREIQQYMQDIDELNAELQQYADMPFNADCWACKQQPWRKIWDAKSERAKELQALVKQKRKKNKDTLEELQQELETLEAWINAKDQYERQKEVMEMQHQHWINEHMEYEKQQEWKKEYIVVCEAVEELGAQLWFTKKYLEDAVKMTQQLKLIEREKELHKAMRDWVKKYEPAEEELENMRKTITWKELSIRLEELEQTLEIDQKKLDRIESWNRAQMRIACIESVLAQREAEGVEVELRDLAHQIKETRMAYGHAQTEWEKHTKLEKMYDAQSAYLKELQMRERKLFELEQWFVGSGDEDGYKKWMYTSKVIPILQKELNQCLRGVENLRMKIEYDKGAFTYMVEDGDRKPSLDKASGYQNFIISLCMRITLGRIGATRHDIRQLIIDEGFTSCDADNLSKMPEFLRTLLRNKDYDSVLLMSHLDGIRESTTMKIDIQQEGPFSYLRVGDPYETPKVAPVVVATVDGEAIEAPKKTRGRPKKVRVDAQS